MTKCIEKGKGAKGVPVPVPSHYLALLDTESGYWFVNEYGHDGNGNCWRETIGDGLTEAEAYKCVDLLEKVQIIFTRGAARLDDV